MKDDKLYLIHASEKLRRCIGRVITSADYEEFLLDDKGKNRDSDCEPLQHQLPAAV